MKQAQQGSTPRTSDQPVKSMPKKVDDSTKTVASQQAQIDQLTEMVNILTRTADQGQLRRLMAQKEQEIVKQLRLREIRGKLVVKWTPLLTNDVYVYKGDVYEDQTLEVTYLDGETDKFSLKDYNRAYKMTDWLDIKGKTVKADGTYYTVDYKGEEVEIEETYIN